MVSNVSMIVNKENSMSYEYLTIKLYIYICNIISHMLDKSIIMLENVSIIFVNKASVLCVNMLLFA